MRWINVNEKYLNYLRNYEPRIPYSDYGANKYKPFFGILFETNDLYYITQISHAQPRHEKMKQQKDFYKIYDSNIKTRLLAVINLNYMFPIPKTEVSLFIKKEIDKYRIFRTKEEKSKYINLLDTELRAINKLPLEEAAQSIYQLKYLYPTNKISMRCLDFKELEKYAHCYIKLSP